MNPIIRNLLSVIRRFKLAATLNVLGLSVAFAAFMVIMIQLNYDYSFDKFHKDSDKIFRLEIHVALLFKTNVPLTPRPFAERFFESSPHIIAGAVTNHTASTLGAGEAYFHVETDDVRNYFKEKSITVSPGFTDVFTFDFVEGADDALNVPGNAILPLSLARKLFGKESAIGRQLIFENENRTVGAVYRDFPANSIIQNCMYFAMPTDENKDNWGNWTYNVFIRVHDASNTPLIIENFMQTFDFTTMFGDDFTWEDAEKEGFTFKMYLSALRDIHFLDDLQYDYAPKASRQTLLILFAIAIVIIAIAAINFTNFSTALTPMRIKSINTMRVLGVRRNMIRRSVLSEAIFVCLLAYLVSLLFIVLFNRTSLARLVEADLSLSANLLIVGGSALTALLTGFFAGVYPSMYWWVYLLAFAAVGMITAATVTFQNWRVASDDPLKAIKSE